MAADSLQSAGQLISRAREFGWGVTFDENRHGQWRISRVVDTDVHELISDSDGAVACRLALAELERLGKGAPVSSDNGRTGTALRPLAAPSKPITPNS